MFPVTFISDSPDSITLSASGATARVQIAKTGNFTDPRYGKFAITLKQYESWKRNFLILHKSDGKLGLPVDRDHSPERRGETEANGWITSLDHNGFDGKTSTPDELWAVVEFNSLGQELIKDKRYAYISPTYKADWADETGKSYGETLVGVALTNRPFLDMACVSLSRAGTATLDLSVPDSPVQMPDMILTAELLTALGVAEDAHATILNAVDPASALAAATAAKPKPAESKTPAEGTPDIKTLAASQGMVVIDATMLSSLTAQAASGAAVAVELAATKFETGFTAAVDRGAVLPAAKPTFALAYEHAPVETLKQLTDLPAVVSMTPRGDGGGATVPSGTTALGREAEQGWEVDEDRDKLHQQALTLSRAENISYDDAIDRVIEGSTA